MAQPSAAVYVRVSTEEQALGGVSLDMQERVCRAEAERLGHTPVLYRDEGYTATNTRRPAYQELIPRIPEHECIIIWRFDRICRSPRDWEQLLAMLEEADTGLVSATEHADMSTPWGRAMLRIMAVFAGLFVEQVQENVRGAMDQIAQEGRKPAGTCYGYVRENKHLVLDEGEAAIVREIFRRLADSETYTGIARDLNGRGVPRKNGGVAWRPTIIRDMAKNPIYIGQFRWKGEWLEGTHEPLVDQQTWDRVRQVVTQRAFRRGAGRRHYTPLLRCGYCGSPIRATHTRVKSRGGTTQRYTAYRCRHNWTLALVDRHIALHVGEPKLVAVIYRHTELLLRDGDFAAAVTAARAEESPGERPDDVRRRLDELDRRRLINLEAARQGSITLSELQSENAPLMAERDRLLAHIETPADHSGIWQDLAGLSREDVIASAQELPVEQQLLFLSALYDHIDLFKERVVFHYVGDALPPAERPLPAYYRPGTSATDLGF